MCCFSSRISDLPFSRTGSSALRRNCLGRRSALQPRTPERRLHSASSLTCSGKQQETASSARCFDVSAPQSSLDFRKVRFPDLQKRLWCALRHAGVHKGESSYTCTAVDTFQRSPDVTLAFGGLSVVKLLSPLPKVQHRGVRGVAALHAGGGRLGILVRGWCVRRTLGVHLLLGAGCDVH